MTTSRAPRTSEPVGPSAAVRLAPGLRVVRRGRDRLQVGLHPERRLVLPRRPGTERLLDDLAPHDPGRASRAERVDADPALLSALAERQLIVPATARRPARIEIRTSPADATWPVDLDPLLGSVDPRLQQVTSRPEAVLLLALGEPDRAALDPLVRDGVPHLVLSLVDGGARLGPLVVPGRTACLRCVDAHLAATDPDHLAVLTRYAAASRQVRPDDVDPALAALVTGWAFRDLALLLHPEGLDDRPPPAPATWSATLTWHPDSPAPGTRRWLRHPGCGCGWAAYVEGDDDPVGPARASGARPSGTMEA